MQIITDIEQGTPEWLAMRLGIVTCSELEALLGVPVDLVTSRSLRPGHEITATAVSV